METVKEEGYSVSLILKISTRPFLYTTIWNIKKILWRWRIFTSFLIEKSPEFELKFVWRNEIRFSWLLSAADFFIIYKSYRKIGRWNKNSVKVYRSYGKNCYETSDILVPDCFNYFTCFFVKIRNNRDFSTGCNTDRKSCLDILFRNTYISKEKITDSERMVIF